ncbi:MAG: flagellar biosynthesis protein [bacterium]|nr:flagellar biosynthesis protein [bacterium]
MAINPVNQLQGVNRIESEQKSVGTSRRTQEGVSGEGLTFSKHLNDRISRRHLDMGPERLARLTDAVDRASDKGARDSVVLLDNLALLVNVPSRTVVTAMETEKMKHGVFTNIDAVVVG